MFKTRRASLLRRLWRSRELSDSSARDGATQAQDTRRGPCGTQRPVTRAEPGDVTESDDRDEEQSVGPGAMCVQRRVTCCLLGDCCLRGPTRDQAGPESADRGLSGATYGFLKKLTEQSLETLVRAVESSGGAPGDCVVVPGQELRPGPGPHFVMCRTFRWCELRPRDTLKALCFCQSHGAAHGTNVCCNPYHYSRVCEPDSPPPPYSLSHSQEHKPAPDAGSSVGSSSGPSSGSHWCSVAYWEQRTRVGRLYPAHDPALSIFYHLPQGTGLCLGQLHANAYHSGRGATGGHLHASGGGTSAALNSRTKIGLGIILSQEEGGVWVYNRSQQSIFVHSPTLEAPGARGLTVERVFPGFSLRVFDYERSRWMAQHGIKPDVQEGPWDPHSIRISFGKGWGPCYSRQFITSCPCWLEVLLNTHR